MPRPDNGTRQKLIDAARDLIWTSSYGSVSVDDICRAAGVQKGSFYHYFPSKLELAMTAMEEHFTQHVEADIARVFAANIPFAQQIDNLADAILKEKQESLVKYGRVCGCPLAALGSEMIGQDEEKTIVARVEEMFAQCRARLFTAVTAAMHTGEIPRGDANALTQEIHDFITGLMMVARVHNSLDGMERDLKSGMQRILGLDDPSFIKQNKSNV